MWRDPRRFNVGHDVDSETYLHCDKCGRRLSNQLLIESPKCEECRKPQLIYHCKKCKQSIAVCYKCNLLTAFGQEDSLSETKRSNNPDTPHYKKNNSKNESSLFDFLTYKGIGLLFLIILALYIYRSTNLPVDPKAHIKQLKKGYPLQNQETWYHVLSVLDTSTPAVRTLTLLHDEDRRTTDCLVRQLVLYYGTKEGIRLEDVTFDNFEGRERDYGEVLEHYLPIVRKYKILVTDLNKVVGSTARIFHSLCDEVSSNIKPSLFIFTLQYDGWTKKLKPIKRGSAILREAWSDLGENEIFPLLSRILKNVVEVVPENKTSCPQLD